MARLSDTPKEYPGEKMVVQFSLKRCIHAEECVHGLPGVFARGARPWVAPDGAAPERVIEVIERCPTGALAYRRLDGGPPEETPDTNSVQVTRDGPLYLRGRIELHLPGGPVQATRVALCRCGASKNKPYCDNMHLDSGFEHDGAIGSATPAEATGDTGPLQLEPLPDGPVLFRGPVRIRDAAGQKESLFTEGAFCRCGGSKNKPFCDGTHSSMGFSTDQRVAHASL